MTGQPSPEDQLRLHHQAGDWYVRRQQPDWTGADERALAAWLAEDPRHRQALDGVGRAWRDAAQLREAFPQAYGASRTPPAPAPLRPGQAARAGRRAWMPAALAAGLLAVLGSGYGWYRWEHTPGYTLDVATAPGETRVVALPDGSSVTLNVDSTLQVRYYRQRRETRLERGEAFFEVAADAGKPFTVDSGAGQVRVIGTAFNVRAGPPALQVQVQRGRVEVRPERARPDGVVLTLGPGAGVAIDPGTARHHAVPVAPDAVGEWRTGQLYFRRVPLNQVAAELARYLGVPVTVEGSATLGHAPVSGLLALRTPERFLQALPSLLAVRVQQQADGSWQILAR